MRTIIFVLAVCLSTATRAYSQRESPIQKGSVQIAGTASFTHFRDIGNDNDWTTLQILPRVGYFVVKGLAVSANLRLQSTWGEISDYTEWGVGPGLTYYVPTGAKRLFPFVSARTLFTRAHLTSDTRTVDGSQIPGADYRPHTNAWLLSGGALYMISRQVGISSEIFYQHDHVWNTFPDGGHDGNSSETWGVQWGLAVFLF